MTDTPLGYGLCFHHLGPAHRENSSFWTERCKLQLIWYIAATQEFIVDNSLSIIFPPRWVSFREVPMFEDWDMLCNSSDPLDKTLHFTVAWGHGVWRSNHQGNRWDKLRIRESANDQLQWKCHTAVQGITCNWCLNEDMFEVKWE